jgi:hypothetical protein
VSLVIIGVLLQVFLTITGTTNLVLDGLLLLLLLLLLVVVVVVAVVAVVVTTY